MNKEREGNVRRRKYHGSIYCRWLRVHHEGTDIHLEIVSIVRFFACDVVLKSVHTDLDCF